MGLRALPFSPSQTGLVPTSHNRHYYSNYCSSNYSKLVVINCAKKAENVNEEDEPRKKRKQSFFNSVTEALDFAQVRSEKDADLLEDAREATQSGERMSKEQVIN